MTTLFTPQSSLCLLLNSPGKREFHFNLLLSSTPLAHAHNYFSLAMGINPFSCSSRCIKSLTLCVPRSLGSTSLLRLLPSSFQKGAKRAALCFGFYFFKQRENLGLEAFSHVA